MVIPRLLVAEFDVAFPAVAFLTVRRTGGAGVIEGGNVIRDFPTADGTRRMYSVPVAFHCTVAAELSIAFVAYVGHTISMRVCPGVLGKAVLLAKAVLKTGQVGAMLG